MSLLLHFILSFLGTMCFSVLFNSPKSSILYGGFCGAVGWTLYQYLVRLGNGPFTSNLAAALCVATLGEIFARLDKKPATVFIIPGIICLVPGYGVYLTIFSIIQDEFQKSLEVGFQTLYSAGAIAVGIIMVSATARIVKRIRT